MGLLRKAAITADGSGSGSGEAAAPTSGRGSPKGPGLLGRSIKALRSVGQTLAEKHSPSTSLTVELAGKSAESDTQPIQFQTRVRADEKELRATPVPAPPSGRRFEDVLEEILSAVSSLRAGVELPSRLFTALTTVLGVRKGALLLYDPVRLVYAPWAVRGYDQTTARRMRIPLGANEAWNALGNGRPLFLDGAPSLAPFQRYFSSREFASVSRLVLVPFISEDKLIAVFELTEIDSPLATDQELSACLARAAEAAAPRVYRARAAQIAASSPGGAPREPLTLKDEPTNFLAAIGSSRTTVLLLLLSLEDYANSVLQAHEHLDPFRLHEDVRYFLGSFLVDIGTALSLKQGRYIIALLDFDPGGLDLFSHQLSMFLQGLFGGTETRADRVLPRIVKSRSWPADGPDLRSLVESLSI